jgi:LysM repeat protein
VRQYAAPAAVLLAVTAAVLGVHYGLQQKATPAPVTTITRPVQPRHHPKRAAVAIGRTYVVQRGDSFSVIAVKTRTSISDLERLNPGVSPTALRVGQVIKVK